MTNFDISGLKLTEITSVDSGLIIFDRSDHILSRIRRIILRSFGEESSIEHQSNNDSYISVVDGEVRIDLDDRRPVSPTLNNKVTLELHSEHNQTLLIPGGVASKLITRGNAKLLIMYSDPGP